MDGSRWLSAGTIGSECYGRMQTRRVLTAVVVTRRSCIDSKVRSKGKKEVGLVKLLVLSLLEVHSAVQITQKQGRVFEKPHEFTEPFRVQLHRGTHATLPKTHF